MELSEKTCTPCRGGVAPLSPEEAARFAAAIPQWRLLFDATRIGRDFKVATYARALELVNAISVVAEAEGHHPDICFGWGYVGVTLQTHKINGLHENDFILAAKIDQVYQAAAAGT